MTTFTSIEKKSVNSPDDLRTFDKGKVELTTFNDGTTIGRITLEPGWSWDKCIKPIVNTNSCQAPHTQYMISGRIKVVMDDGTEKNLVLAIPPSSLQVTMRGLLEMNQ